jgi:signal transduction histidine kinase
MSKSEYKPLLSVKIKTELDVVLARRRARQIAYLLGFDSHNQTRISTAVSEITRNALVHGGGGKLDFCLSDQTMPYRFTILLKDFGPGISDLEEILAGRTEYMGLVGAGRLVDSFHVENDSGGGALVRLEKNMPLRTKAFSMREIDELTTSLAELLSSDPVDEVYQQNQELLEALEQLSMKQIELDKLNLDLERTNSDLSALNNDMRILNESLETKVLERTNELVELNATVGAARDEAVLANKLKSQFVANVSHEIRTPMSGILGATELVMDSENLDQDSRELLGIAHHSAKNLMTVINDLLDFSKLEAGKAALHESDFYMASLLDEVIESIIGAVKKKGLTLNESLSSAFENKLLIGDSDLIKRIFLNFLHNAVKFTESGSISIVVEAAYEDEFSITIRGAVSDTGIGIEEHNKSRLFQPFVQADGSNTRKYGGTGLGLSLSSGYVSLMGGKIGFESEKGSGSRFWFVVPVRKHLTDGYLVQA